MHAALITGKEQVELIEFDEPVPAADGVVVDITYCGVCGTDVHHFQSGRPYTPSVCGHEWVGALSAVGGDVKGLSEGDRVVVATPPACGQCGPCGAGHPDICATVFMVTLGRDPGAPPHGGFAPRLAVPQGRVVKANPDISDIEAAQVEPATITYHAVRRSGINLGDIAVIQGAGPIGLTTLQWVRAAGAGEVIVIEPGEARRAMAMTLGATVAVGPGDEATELVRERTHGLGADIVYECAGLPSTIQTAVDFARRGGELSIIGLAEGDAPISPTAWLIKEITATAALGYYHEEFEQVMGLIADGRMQLAPMHSATVGLDGLQQALADLASGSSGATKVLVDPRANA